MSAKGRTKLSKELRPKFSQEALYTPEWCVERFMEAAQSVGMFSSWHFQGSWLEPAVGDGALLRGIASCQQPKSWIVCDIDNSAVLKTPDSFPMIEVLGDSFTDYLRTPLDEKLHVLITNPPFSLAREFLKKGLKDVVEGGWVIMLLRLNWLAPKKTARELAKVGMPDWIFVLPNRPSFDGYATDACEYAWMCWKVCASNLGVNPQSNLRILPETPKAVLKAAKEKSRQTTDARWAAQQAASSLRPLTGCPVNEQNDPSDENTESAKEDESGLPG